MGVSPDFHQPTLELNSVSWKLGLSEQNTKLTCNDESRNYPNHPERYSWLAQALCKQGLSGRSYWEVEWRGPQVYVGVSYKGVDRKCCGISRGFGHNSQSWSLCCGRSESIFWHDDKGTKVVEPVSSRIGVYLDHRAGTLCFYSVSNRMALLHSISTRFHEPLHPGFWVFDGSNVRICQNGEKVFPEAERRNESSLVDSSCFQLQFYFWRCKGQVY